MVHPDLLRRFEAHKALKSSERLKRSATTDELEAGPSDMKKAKMTQSLLLKSCNIQQNKVDDLILNYIISEMRPLSTVEKPSFIALVSGLAPSRTVACRKTVKARINKNYEVMRSNLKSELAIVSYACTTADIWSSHNRSYMGMTVHWISESYVRKSATLSCKRFTGSHTYDKIADVISEVHTDFGLSLDKITSTVTDNASNFAKAFASFSAPDSYSDTSDEEEEDEAVEDITVMPVSDILVNVDSDCDVYVPPHNRCAAHTLNLIATTDADKALSEKSYSRIYHTSFAKCQAVWNAVHRSSKAADSVKAICIDKIIICPCPTRWNSKFDAVHRLLELVDKLPAVCDALNISRFKPTEIDFLREYDMAMQPVASTLDILQGDKNCFYGMLLPKLVLLRNKLSSLETGTESQPELHHARPLLLALLGGLSTRYGDLLDLHPTAKEAIIAAVAHPQFKLRWVPPSRKDEISSMFVAAVTSVANKVPSRISGQQSSTESTGPSDDEDYGYGVVESSNPGDTSNVTETRVNRVRIEAMNYLQDKSKELQSLSSYRNVSATFLKYNTTLPSSAPVERLFSIGGLILSPRRNKLSDAMFEKLLMLKTNG